MWGTSSHLFPMSPRRSHVAALAAATLLSACSFSFGGSSTQNTPAAQPTSGKPTAQSLMSDMTKAMQDQKSMGLMVAFNFSVDDKTSGENVKLNLALNGKSDMRSADDNRAQFNITADVSGKMQGQDLTGSVDSDLSMIKKDLYARLNSLTLPAAASAMVPAGMIDELKGKWYIFENVLEKTKDLAQGSGSAGDLATAFSGENATPEQKAKMEKLFQERFADVFDKTLEDGAVSIGGVDTTKISVKLNKPQMVSFLKEAATISGKPMSASDATELEQGLKEVDFTGAIYIGTSDKLLYKVEGTFTPATGSAMLAKGNFTVGMKMEMSNYGKNQDINAPTGAEKFDAEAFMAKFAPPAPTDDLMVPEGLDSAPAYDGGSVE